MSREIPNCHPSRPHHALGLCSSCYNHKRNKLVTRDPRKPYVDDVADMVNTVEGLDWDDLSRFFGRERKNIYRAMYNAGYTDLISKVNRVQEARRPRSPRGRKSL